MNLFIIALGGAIGSVARYLMQSFVGHYTPGSDFPYGTLLVNITGSVIMGIFVGWLARANQGSQEQIRLFVAIGMLGGYTTFSSFSLETINLMDEHRWGAMSVYIASSVVFSLAGLYIGRNLMRLLS